MLVIIENTLIIISLLSLAGLSLMGELKLEHILFNLCMVILCVYYKATTLNPIGILLSIISCLLVNEMKKKKINKSKEY